jgi:hypothetical protein
MFHQSHPTYGLSVQNWIHASDQQKRRNEEQDATEIVTVCLREFVSACAVTGHDSFNASRLWK